MLATSATGRKCEMSLKAVKSRRHAADTNPPPIVVTSIAVDATPLLPAGFDLAAADIHTLADLQRKAISVVDNLPEPKNAAEDNANLAAAMEPVRRIFNAIKTLTPSQVPDIALQMTIIAEVVEWFGGDDPAMEDISAVEFRRLANNLDAVVRSAMIPSCRLAELALSYDKIAAVLRDDDGLEQLPAAAEKALNYRLSDIMEKATKFSASSPLGAAFAVMMAFTQLHLTRPGEDPDAMRRVEKLLYGARDYFAREFARLPDATGFSMPDHCDPRKAVL